MYIISKRKDYYDGVVGTVGIDKKIVYERQIVELENAKEYPKEIINLYDEKGDKYYYRTRGLNSYNLKDEQKRYEACCAFLVGFCGKLYVGWKFYRKIKRRYGSWDDEYAIDFCYDINDASNYIDVKIGKTTFLQDQLNKIANANVIDVFREFNTPVFVYNCEWSPDNYGGKYPHSFTINPNLKELQFTKVFDAFTAFQEIQMFISGVLGIGEKEIIEIEDKYKIGQHGFNKWSFRREPGSKKPKV